MLVKATSKISNFNASSPPSITHAMIYTATNEISHASTNKPVPDAIKTKQCTASDSYYGGKVFFIFILRKLYTHIQTHGNGSSIPFP